MYLKAREGKYIIPDNSFNFFLEASNYASDNSANIIPFIVRVFFYCSYMHHLRIVNTLADNNKSITEKALRKRYLILASSITDPYTV